MQCIAQRTGAFATRNGSLPRDCASIKWIALASFARFHVGIFDGARGARNAYIQTQKNLE